MSQTLTVKLPNELYVRIKQRADESRRSVEDEAVELLATTVPANGELDHAITGLALLDNAALENAAASRLPGELSAELESLHFKQQRKGLSDIESARCAELVRAYERSMLVRAHAAALLKKRGVEVQVKFLTEDDRTRGFYELARRSRVGSLPGRVYQVPLEALQILDSLQIGYRLASDDHGKD
jgi:plasmid stability protein